MNPAVDAMSPKTPQQSDTNMPIYRRTPAGNEAALNSKGALPRKLRSLLMVVNGNTRLSVYLQTLSSFGDVGALMGALEAQGLVELVLPARAASISNVQAAPRSAPSAAWTPAPSALAASPATLTDDLAAWASFGDELPAAGSVPAGNAAFGSAAYPLRKVMLLVSDFVVLHLPEQSLEIMLAFDTLTSAEQVMGSLDGYETLIAPLGEPARRHLAELRQTLTTT